MRPICEPKIFLGPMFTSVPMLTDGVLMLAGKPSITISPFILSMFRYIAGSYFAGIVLMITLKVLSNPFSSSGLFGKSTQTIKYVGGKIVIKSESLMHQALDLFSLLTADDILESFYIREQPVS